MKPQRVGSSINNPFNFDGGLHFILMVETILIRSIWSFSWKCKENESGIKWNLGEGHHWNYMELEKYSGELKPK